MIEIQLYRSRISTFAVKDHNESKCHLLGSLTPSTEPETMKIFAVHVCRSSSSADLLLCLLAQKCTLQIFILNFNP